MSLSVEFFKPWTYSEDADGNVKRSIPSGWVGELADDVAAAAIFDGVATARGAITPDVQHYLDVFAMIQSGASEEDVNAAIQQLPSLQDPPHDPETGEVSDDPPAETPPATKRKRQAAG